MIEVKIKQEFQSVVIAFGGGGRIELKDRSQSDLAKLAIVALQSKNKNLLNLFEGELPPLVDLQKSETETKIKAGPVNKAEKVQLSKESTPGGDNKIVIP